MESLDFTILWPILHLWNANTGKNSQLEKLYKSHFGGIKEQNNIGDVSSI